MIVNNNKLAEVAAMLVVMTDNLAKAVLLMEELSGLDLQGVIERLPTPKKDLVP